MINKIRITEDGVTKDYAIGQVPSEIAANFKLSGSKGTNMTITSKNHLNLESAWDDTNADEEDSSVTNTSRKKGKDIKIKPGDDIQLCSHHRAANNSREVSIQAVDGVENPVELKIQSTMLTLTSKGRESATKKDGTPKFVKNDNKDEYEVFDLNIKGSDGQGSDKKGYLKVRARAIDLRCEDHGGIALQPKGRDHKNTGNMNKIKFEHGGGDGLEFGTFNAEKTSIFTDEYRFNKNGIVMMSTREKEDSDKYDGVDDTTQYKYKKQSDDFYDKIAEPFRLDYTVNNNKVTYNDSVGDELSTWNDIIKTSFTFNTPTKLYPEDAQPEFKFKTHVSKKGNLEIESKALSYEWQETNEKTYAELSTNSKKIKASIDDLPEASSDELGNMYGVTANNKVYICVGNDAKSINIESEGDLKVKAYNSLKIDGGKATSIKGNEIEVGSLTLTSSTVDFGEADKGIQYHHKLTKKKNLKGCDVLQLVVTNNYKVDTKEDPDATIENHTMIWTPRGATVNGEDISFVAGQPSSEGTFINNRVVIKPGQSIVVGQISIQDLLKMYLDINNIKTTINNIETFLSNSGYTPNEENDPVQPTLNFQGWRCGNDEYIGDDLSYVASELNPTILEPIISVTPEGADVGTITYSCPTMGGVVYLASNTGDIIVQKHNGSSAITKEHTITATTSTGITASKTITITV